MSVTKEQVILLANRLHMDQGLLSKVKESMELAGYQPIVVQGAIAICEQMTALENGLYSYSGDDSL